MFSRKGIANFRQIYIYSALTFAEMTTRNPDLFNIGGRGHHEFASFFFFYPHLNFINFKLNIIGQIKTISN